MDNRRDAVRDEIEQLRSAMTAIGHEQHERTNTLAQTLAKMAEEQKVFESHHTPGSSASNSSRQRFAVIICAGHGNPRFQA